MPLADIEQSFMQCLIKPYHDADMFMSNLVVTGSLSPEKQISIYRSNINGAHESVLAQIYPACKTILGEGYFNQLCLIYRIQFPSKHADLNKYGKHFPVFIKVFLEKHNELQAFSYLSDLALLEWNWHAIYYSCNDLPFDFSLLANVAEEQQQKLVFHLSNTVSLQSSCYPVLAIWRANSAELNYEKQESEQAFEMPDEEICFCIFRDNYEMALKELSTTQFEILQAIKAGQTLGELSDSFGDDLQPALNYYIQQGWISGFSVDEMSNVR